jgi:hypothetical protein
LGVARPSNSHFGFSLTAPATRNSVANQESFANYLSGLATRQAVYATTEPKQAARPRSGVTCFEEIATVISLLATRPEGIANDSAGHATESAGYATANSGVANESSKLAADSLGFATEERIAHSEISASASALL